MLQLAMQQKNREVLGAIFLGGLIAATIDIGAASLISGRSPAFIIAAIYVVFVPLAPDEAATPA
jgi:hypothetical protein